MLSELNKSELFGDADVDYRSFISLAGWKPIKELNRTDAAVSLIFLTANGVMYNDPVEDPLFGAHRQGDDLTVLAYRADNEITAIACTDQYQFCDSSTSPKKRCTNLTASDPLSKEAGRIFPQKNSTRRDTASRLYNSLLSLSMDAVIRGRGSVAVRGMRNSLNYCERKLTCKFKHRKQSPTAIKRSSYLVINGRLSFPAGSKQVLHFFSKTLWSSLLGIQILGKLVV
jgi:hypothetical protein